MKKNYFGDKQFIFKIITIALPIGLQNLLISSVNMVDNLMIGTLGDQIVAAVGQANRYFFLASLFTFGIASGINVLTTQYAGKKDNESVKKMLGISIIGTLLVSLPFFVFVTFFSQTAMSIFSKDPLVIAQGAIYLKITGAGYLFMAVQNAYAFSLRATQKIKLPIISSVVSLVCNIILNYILIFGNFGAPKLSIAGAAIATLTANIVGTLVLVVVVYIKKYIQAASIRQLFVIDKQIITKAVSTTLPVFFNESLWSLGVVIYPFVYGRMGTVASAAMNVTTTVGDLAFVLFFGLSSATAIIVGTTIGSGDLKRAHQTGVWVTRISWVFGIIMGGVLALSVPLLLKLYPNLLPETINATRISLYIFAAIMPFRIYNLCMIVGVFRSGGDVKFCMFTDMLSVWGISVPLVLIAGLVLGLPVYIVFLCTYIEEIIKVFICLWRFKSEKWINMLV